ncbi:hypothetical protein I302_105392 [Kwoniella bestiolae CBS 10118]|uniref:Uncharacterized protein n=1 Tax=Kwoniella bestiolae CBS 10118 TaxID=1296100 RepID=A0A1B9FSZ8_9TREE|nr:hypothetical protein I302_08673 [Kwoniella bestiolae CBS 10118]OCF21894.1 hypothetical protein I302_08673 [Kwoniella bestiolae CBS 10118]
MNPPNQLTSSGIKREREEGDDFFASLASDPILHEKGGAKKSSSREADDDETESQAEFWRSSKKRLRKDQSSGGDGSGKGELNVAGAESSSKSHTPLSTTRVITPTPNTPPIRARAVSSTPANRPSWRTSPALPPSPPIPSQRQHNSARQPNHHFHSTHPYNNPPLHPHSYSYQPHFPADPYLVPPPHPYINNANSQYRQHPHYLQYQAIPPPHVHPIPQYAGYPHHPGYLHTPSVFVGQDDTGHPTSHALSTHIHNPPSPSNTGDMALKTASMTSDILRQSLSSTELECQRLSGLLNQERENARVIRVKYEVEREERSAVQAELTREREEHVRALKAYEKNLEFKKDRAFQTESGVKARQNGRVEEERQCRIYGLSRYLYMEENCPKLKNDLRDPSEGKISMKKLKAKADRKRYKTEKDMKIGR